MRGRLRLGEVEVEIEILDTPAGRALAEVLPLEVPFQAGEEEIQFSLPLHPLPADPEEEWPALRGGDIRYVAGSNLLVLSIRPDEPPSARPGSDAPALAGRVLGSASRLRAALHAATLRIETVGE